ncbi:cobalt ABC transporter permease [Eubacterium multiforme]|uniref:Regulator of replication initiation timing n=1 Tax=Eubacterium multiforme TaxID=83339 RepID=A0ABT9US22_9FIRM|nr:cobalt ABC transporter permease [Eubacterium multiforme]MDQ0149115.1 regulator of replication initiation timing [Eubacterium multiforme]
MKETIVNEIIPSVGPVLIAAIMGVFVAIVKSVADVIIKYVGKKKEVVEQRLQLDKHIEEVETAKQVWNIVEEKYRITDNIKQLVKSKADEFDKLLLEKIPYLNEKDVKELRLAIAGKVNEGREMLNKDSINKQAKELVDKNSKLETENIELKNKLAAISNYVPTEDKTGQ